MNTTYLRQFAKEFIANHPNLKSEVNDFVQLCFDEIEEGGSESHEVELCISSIKQLID